MECYADTPDRNLSKGP